MNTIRTTAVTLFTAATLCAAPLAEAGTTNRTKATLAGAAVGGVVGNLAGNNLQSTLIGAAVGGTAGNLIAKNNQKKEARKAAERRRHRRWHFD